MTTLVHITVISDSSCNQRKVRGNGSLADYNEKNKGDDGLRVKQDTKWEEGGQKTLLALST